MPGKIVGKFERLRNTTSITKHRRQCPANFKGLWEFYTSLHQKRYCIFRFVRRILERTKGIGR